MSDAVRSVKARCFCEKTIEKSRFLSYCDRVQSEEEAKAFLSEIRALHPQATHCCYGFIADKTGAFQRFSDDKEPQGTAGMPILEVIKNKKLFETAVAVVRYFGGVKLGAGGLVRAYSSAAADVLDRAEICLWRLASAFCVHTDYSRAEGAQKFFSSRDCIVERREYGADATFYILVDTAQEESFVAALTDCLSGRVRFEKTGERYYPFDEK